MVTLPKTFLAPRLRHLALENISLPKRLRELSPALSDVERLTLDFGRGMMPTEWRYDETDGHVDGTTWHGLLRPFVNVKKLCICDSLAEELSSALEVDGIGSDPGFLPRLQELVMRPPSLNYLFRSFIHARRLAGLPGCLALPTPSPTPS
ncbi:hypothetical protein EI94DRAFT_1805891 [Lactarius quietus]|nr:hypothetical protein EI94DRAFT_1805891 [Lactarius quietus]